MLLEQRQQTIKDNKKAHQRKGYQHPQSKAPDNENQKAASYALNALIAECLKLVPEHVRRGNYQAEKRKILRLKNQGKVLLSFSEILKDKDEKVNL